MVTHNDLLWMAVRKETSWFLTRDWSGYTKEQIYKEEQDKTTEFYNELCQEYGLK